MSKAMKAPAWKVRWSYSRTRISTFWARNGPSSSSRWCSIAAGLISIALKGGLRYGIDFKGGALMTVKFAGKPPVDQIRAALAKRIRGDVSVQSFTDVAENNEVVIGTELPRRSCSNANRRAMEESLQATLRPARQREAGL